MPEIRGNGRKMAPEIEKVRIVETSTVAYDEALRAAEEEKAEAGAKKADGSVLDPSETSAAPAPDSSKSTEKVSVFTKDESPTVSKPAEKPETKETIIFGSVTSSKTEKPSELPVTKTTATTTPIKTTATTNPVKEEKTSGGLISSGSAFGYGYNDDTKVGDSFTLRETSGSTVSENNTGKFYRAPKGQLTREQARANAIRSIRALKGNITPSGDAQNDEMRLYMAKTVHDAVTIEGWNEATESKLIEAYTDYQLNMNKASTREEKVLIGKKFAEYTRIKINMPLIEERLNKLVQEGKLTPEQVEKQMQVLSKLQSYILDVRLSLANDKEEEEISIQNHAEDIEPAHNDLLDMVAKVMPENTSPQDAKAMLSKVSEYAVAQRNDIVIALASEKYSASFKTKIMDVCSKIILNTAKSTRKYIEKFFETAKGKAILAYARHAIHEVKEAKKEYKESLAEVETAKEQAELAKEQSEKAMEDAKKAEKEAKSLIAQVTKQSKVKLQDVDPTSSKFIKFVKSISPRIASKLCDAQEEQTKAYWLKWDADSAVRLANASAEIARKSLEIARTKMAVIMASISGYMG